MSTDQKNSQELGTVYIKPVNSGEYHQVASRGIISTSTVESILEDLRHDKREPFVCFLNGFWQTMDDLLKDGGLVSAKGVFVGEEDYVSDSFRANLHSQEIIQANGHGLVKQGFIGGIGYNPNQGGKITVIRSGITERMAVRLDPGDYDRLYVLPWDKRMPAVWLYHPLERVLERYYRDVTEILDLPKLVASGTAVSAKIFDKAIQEGLGRRDGF